MASASLRDGSDPAAAGSLSVFATGGTIRVTGRGFFSDAVIERHFEELRQVALRSRPHHPRLRVVIDMREAAVQAASTTARIERETRRIWARDDRIAIIVQAGLTKLQLARIVDDRNHRTFETLEAAQRWFETG